jgi:hypothetical protein
MLARKTEGVHEQLQKVPYLLGGRVPIPPTPPNPRALALVKRPNRAVERNLQKQRENDDEQKKDQPRHRRPNLLFVGKKSV